MIKTVLAQAVAVIFLSVLSLSTYAGNVIIKKNADEKVAYNKESFELTEHSASTSAVKWDRVFAVCRFDCLFSGFNGSISDLKINGKLVYEGPIDVINSTITIDRFGKVIVYIAKDLIVLELTPDQIKMLENP